MKKGFDLEEVKEFIRNSSSTSKIYLGCDSEKIRKNGRWYADYTMVCVIHKDGNKGGKVFGDVVREPVYDKKQDRPSFRLMTEVYKASQLYLDLFDVFGDRHVEVHLDINPDLMHGSSCVLHEAIGYVRGMCNIEPKVKPEAFAASFGADRFKDLNNISHPREPKMAA